MEGYKNLLKYIPYFENDTNKFYTWSKTEKSDNNTIQLGYPIYDQTFNRFINETYDINILKFDYKGYLDTHLKDSQTIDEHITDACLELLRSILTHLIRTERFNEGSWCNSIDNKVFLKILYRLKELINNKCLVE